MGPHSAGAPPCERCKQRRIMMIAMAPGPDGKEWWLCPKCHAHGTEGTKVVEPTKPAADKPSKKAREPRSKAKEETANFDKHPNGPKNENEERSRFAWTGGTGTYVPDEDNFW